MPHIQSMSKIPEERRRKFRTRSLEAPDPNPLLCEKVCKICRSADVPTSEAAYRSVRTGVSPPPLECTPVPSLLLLGLLLLDAPITSHRISGAAVRF